VRAANTGISAIVDPFGREIARTELMEQTILTGEVRPVVGQTFYARHGDVFAWSVVGVSLLLCAVAAFVARKASAKLPRPATTLDHVAP
jgi:apolipoprotein N-acyltransferase